MDNNLPQGAPVTPEPTPVTTPPVNANPQQTNETKSADANNSSLVFNENSIMAALSYFGPLVIIPYLTKKDNPFVLFHIKQGLVVFALWVGLWVIDEVTHLRAIIDILDIALVILSIFGIVYALQKKEKQLPLVGQFASYIKI